jgi:hypothetical protein
MLKNADLDTTKKYVSDNDIAYIDELIEKAAVDQYELNERFNIGKKHKRTRNYAGPDYSQLRAQADFDNIAFMVVQRLCFEIKRLRILLNDPVDESPYVKPTPPVEKAGEE